MGRMSSDVVPTGADDSAARGAQPQQESRDALEARIAKLEAERAGGGAARVSAKTIALVASLIAAVVPGTTALQAWFKNRSDLALASQQQDHAMRMDYVKTVLSSEVAERDREARLRLLVAILEPTDRLTIWAKDELAATQNRIGELEVQVEAATEEALAAKARELEATQKLAELRAKLPGTEAGAGVAQPTAPAARPTPAARAEQVAVVEEISRVEAQAQTARRQMLQAATKARTKKEALSKSSTNDPLSGLDL